MQQLSQSPTKIKLPSLILHQIFAGVSSRSFNLPPEFAEIKDLVSNNSKGHDLGSNMSMGDIITAGIIHDDEIDDKKAFLKKVCPSLEPSFIVDFHSLLHELTVLKSRRQEITPKNPEIITSTQNLFNLAETLRNTNISPLCTMASSNEIIARFLTFPTLNQYLSTINNELKEQEYPVDEIDRILNSHIDQIKKFKLLSYSDPITEKPLDTFKPIRITVASIDIGNLFGANKAGEKYKLKNTKIVGNVVISLFATLLKISVKELLNDPTIDPDLKTLIQNITIPRVGGDEFNISLISVSDNNLAAVKLVLERFNENRTKYNKQLPTLFQINTKEEVIDINGEMMFNVETEQIQSNSKYPKLASRNPYRDLVSILSTGNIPTANIISLPVNVIDKTDILDSSTKVNNLLKIRQKFETASTKLENLSINFSEISDISTLIDYLSNNSEKPLKKEIVELLNILNLIKNNSYFNDNFNILLTRLKEINNNFTGYSHNQISIQEFLSKYIKQEVSRSYDSVLNVLTVSNLPKTIAQKRIIASYRISCDIKPTNNTLSQADGDKAIEKIFLKRIGLLYSKVYEATPHKIALIIQAANEKGSSLGETLHKLYEHFKSQTRDSPTGDLSKYLVFSKSGPDIVISVYKPKDCNAEFSNFICQNLESSTYETNSITYHGPNGYKLQVPIGLSYIKHELRTEEPSYSTEIITKETQATIETELNVLRDTAENNRFKAFLKLFQANITELSTLIPENIKQTQAQSSDMAYLLSAIAPNNNRSYYYIKLIFEEFENQLNELNDRNKGPNKIKELASFNSIFSEYYSKLINIYEVLSEEATSNGIARSDSTKTTLGINLISQFTNKLTKLSNSPIFSDLSRLNLLIVQIHSLPIKFVEYFTVFLALHTMQHNADSETNLDFPETNYFKTIQTLIHLYDSAFAPNNSLKLTTLD